jgi:hypothetical protein
MGGSVEAVVEIFSRDSEAAAANTSIAELLATASPATLSSAFGVSVLSSAVQLYSGCTDSTASNYDESASFDDGSFCIPTASPSPPGPPPGQQAAENPGNIEAGTTEAEGKAGTGLCPHALRTDPDPPPIPLLVPAALPLRADEDIAARIQLGRPGLAWRLAAIPISIAAFVGIALCCYWRRRKKPYESG